jgi:ribonuclease-3
MKNYLQPVFDFLALNHLPIQDQDLAVRALCHSSFAAEHSMESNQRLEFLGDAILYLIVGEYVYRTYPHFQEGELSLLRSRLICEDALYQVGQRLRIGEYILLGKGELANGGRGRKSMIADAVEALIGAYYLDSGLEAVRSWLIALLQEDMTHILREELLNYKNRLQELVQSWGKENVVYQLLSESGPPHDKWFVSGVFYKNRLLGEGSGHSKKESEQKAAEMAMQSIGGRQW